ncbi:hypothetical protein V6N13_041059 [Hibiscus sabdariffa]|uniref:TF-B3 domain-containing protein n=1 Tax=Hibiscus sabdariffa TaxID=183260 RepID=A0ABR2RA95_9ROSI
MPGRKLVTFNFMDDYDGGNISPKLDNHVSLDLSLSLGYTSSSAATDKVKQELDFKKLQCKEKISGGAFPLGSSDAGNSLKLCLSSDNISTEAIQYKESSDQCTRDLAVPDLSPEASDISLDLCLGMNKSRRIDVGNNCGLKNDFDSGLGLTLALNAWSTSNNKKKRIYPKLSANTNKKRKLVAAATDQVHDPWCIKKKLVPSDLSDMSRLLLAKNLVESSILPNWDADRRTQVHTEGVQVSVYDCDTNNEYAMDFKRWRNGAYVFIKKWIPNFVKRRDLKINDEIGIYWDIHNSRFNFSVLNRAPTE